MRTSTQYHDPRTKGKRCKKKTGNRKREDKRSEVASPYIEFSFPHFPIFFHFFLPFLLTISIHFHLHGFPRRSTALAFSIILFSSVFHIFPSSRLPFSISCLFFYRLLSLLHYQLYFSLFSSISSFPFFSVVIFLPSFIDFFFLYYLFFPIFIFFLLSHFISLSLYLFLPSFYHFLDLFLVCYLFSLLFVFFLISSLFSLVLSLFLPSLLR